MTTAVAVGRNRYETLDAWRALAALAVVGFHGTATLTRGADAWGLRPLSMGWAGVFVFFPISGYCILAAASRSENATARSFLWRRWRRIAPPYWASLALAIGVLIASALVRGVPTAPLGFGARWLAILTLTQGMAGIPDAINPVYWSLCYEEQFYLVIALTLLWCSRDRLSTLWLITAASVVYQTVWPSTLRITGLFLEYWLPFAAGLAAFGWLHLAGRRVWAGSVFAMVAVVAAVTANVAIAISLAVSLAIVSLAAFDHVTSTNPIGRWLVVLGGASYSLYLVHVPVLGPVVHALERLSATPPVSVAAGVIASVVAAWIFHRVVERRFINQPTDTAPRPEPSPVMAAMPALQVAAETTR